MCQGLFRVAAASQQYQMRAYESRSMQIKSFGPAGISERTEKMVRRSEYTDDYMGFIVTPLQMDEADRAHFLAAGIQETHRNYGSRLSDAEKKLVMQSDWDNFGVSLSSENLGYAAIGHGNITVGFLRVYDGTDKSTPAEVLLRKKSVKTSYFDQFRSRKIKIYELGKYFLESTLNSQDRHIVRSEMFEWLIKTYLSGSKESLAQKLFIIDVSSLAHAKAYQKMFGAQIIPAENFSPRLTDVDFIMTVEASVLKENLLRLINQ